jgi:osmoprotectant transport system permease protein
MSLFKYLGQFFGNKAYQHGYDSILNRSVQHAEYSLLALAIAAALALPPAIASGHAGRGQGPISAVAAIGRAMPSLGLITVLAVKEGFSFTVALIPLVLLAIPPILLYTYEGMRSVERSVVDAARGMGMSPVQVALRVEVPAALPMILSGLRAAAIQVVATATLAAVISFGGLGRYIMDGLSEFDYSQVVGGAFLVVLMSLATLAIFRVLEVVLVSPGVKRRS